MLDNKNSLAEGTPIFPLCILGIKNKQQQQKEGVGVGVGE